VAAEISQALAEAGYEVRPAYTGNRGGELFDIIISEADKIADLTAKPGGAIVVIITAIQKLRAKSQPERPGGAASQTGDRGPRAIPAGDGHTGCPAT